MTGEPALRPGWSGHGGSGASRVWLREGRAGVLEGAGCQAPTEVCHPVYMLFNTQEYLNFFNLNFFFFFYLNRRSCVVNYLTSCKLTSDGRTKITRSSLRAYEA